MGLRGGLADREQQQRYPANEVLESDVCACKPRLHALGPDGVSGRVTRGTAELVLYYFTNFTRQDDARGLVPAPVDVPRANVRAFR